MGILAVYRRLRELKRNEGINISKFEVRHSLQAMFRESAPNIGDNEVPTALGSKPTKKGPHSDAFRFFIVP